MILVTIDHDNHQAFIDVVSDALIDQQEEYLIKKYGFEEGDNWTWDYLAEKIEVFGEGAESVINSIINFNTLGK